MAKRAARSNNRADEQVGTLLSPSRHKILNASQKRAWQLLQEKPIVVLAGPAGCGKTHVSLEYACYALKQRIFDKIVFIRSPLEAGRSRIGYIPGTVAEKMAPYTAPLFAIAKKLGIPPEMIHCEPTGFIQGMTFERSIVIVDECQNLTVDEFRAVVTRLGTDSQMILAGDPEQDTRRSGGMPVFLARVEGLDCVGVQRFDDADNMRHPAILAILGALKGL